MDEGPYSDDPRVVAGIDLVRWELSLLLNRNNAELSVSGDDPVTSLNTNPSGLRVAGED